MPAKRKTPTLDPLRMVPDDKAFYFYVAWGIPHGTKANSLEEFLKSIEEVGETSLEFHLSREDFEDWIAMLGDEILRRQIANLKKRDLTPEARRKEFIGIIQTRVERLSRASRPNR